MELNLDDARRRYGWALTDEDRDRLPFYDALTRALADDLSALKLLAGVRAEQRNPMLVLAALQLLGYEGHPILGPVYDDVRRGVAGSVSERVDLVLGVVDHEGDLIRAHLGRATQTNEPGRSAVLQAVVPLAAAGADAVNVLDVGTSAGINLHFDRFPVRDRDDDNPLTLVCEDRGGVDRSRPPPRVVSRVGIDLTPLDLTVRADQLWLLSCLWPEEPRRVRRLEAVIAQRASWPPVTIVVGDALARLDDALALGDGDHLTVIVDTWFAAYLGDDAQIEYYERVRALCEAGRAAWVSMELPIALRWPAPHGRTDAPGTGATEVTVTTPGGRPEHVGWCHHHGRWLDLDRDVAPPGAAPVAG
ncbi:MAG: DUF2332 family protein [Acidimicrobiales bacterium]